MLAGGVGAGIGHLAGRNSLVGGVLGAVIGSTGSAAAIDKQRMDVRLPAKIKAQIESGYYTKKASVNQGK